MLKVAKIHYVPYRTWGGIVIWSADTQIMPGRKKTRKTRKASISEIPNPAILPEARSESEQEQVRIDGWVSLADMALKPAADPDDKPEE